MKKVLFFAATVYLFSSVLCAQPASADGRVVYVSSYNNEYRWSREIGETITDILTKNGIVTETYFLNSHNSSEKQLKTTAEKIITSIKTEKPDVIIISDDPAAKYIITPDILASGIPIVFCGINWDASFYGLTPDNSTGMIETNPAGELFDAMTEIVGKNKDNVKIGLLTAETMTQHKNYYYERKIFKTKFNSEFFVKNMSEWEKAYRELQKTSDYIYMPNLGGIHGWDKERALKVINENKKVPACAVIDETAEFVLLTFSKFPKEHGKFAAESAVRIINGEKIRNIPFAVNKLTRVLLNGKSAENLGISVPRDILELSEIIQ